MSNRTIIITVISLLAIGVILALINLGTFGGNKNSNITVDKVIQDANEEAFGGQDISNTAKAILQKGIASNDQSNIEGGNEDYFEYNTIYSIENAPLLDTYKVDKLLDDTLVFSLSRDAISKLNLQNYYPIDKNEKLCISGCTLAKQKDKYLIIDSNVYYLSSFSKANKTIWIGFVKGDNGYVYAKIAKPGFLNPKAVYFTGQNIIKINQKGPNSSEYSFDIKDKDSIVVDFKDSSAVVDANNESLGEE